jgi:hypothetical protein
MCPHPFSKTKFIKFLPRYIIANKLTIPLVFKEKNSLHQMVLMPGEELFFNDGQDEEDQLMVRALNLAKETRARVETRPIDINALPSSHHSEERQRVVSSTGQRREVQASDPRGEEVEVELSRDYAKEIGLWSYNFGLSKIDDFHIIVPNPNPIAANENGWQY